MPGPQETEFVAYTTHIERVVGGIPVLESQAWASFNARDEVVSEGVFWPPISADVVARASAMRDAIADPVKHAELRSTISRTMPELGKIEGRVVIAHTPASYGGTITAISSYDVIMPGEGSYVRHFDESGAEVKLPREITEMRPSDPKQ